MFKASIKKKIIASFFVILGLMFLLSCVSLFALGYMEKKLVSLETVSSFVDTTLEMRRFEKNLFLYGKYTDKEDNVKYTFKAIALLEDNRKTFSVVMEEAKILELKEKLKTYNALIKGVKEDGNVSADMVNSIRAIGKEITTEAENLSALEKKHLRSTLLHTKLFIAVSIVLMALVLVITGHVISKIVVKPLKELEDSMKLISSGGFEKLYVNSKDREIISLIDTFNNMLRDMELKHQHLIQSEKLVSLGTLLSGVAHELNNPLSNISSSCQILAEEIDDTDLEYKKQLVNQIDEQTIRARNIVRSILEFSSHRDFTWQSVELKKLIEETILFIRTKIIDKITITVEVPDNLLLFADKQKLQQALLNLIINAADSIKGKGNITINATYGLIDSVDDELHCVKGRSTCIHEGNFVDIKISDTGEGMTADVITKIFDPFFTTKDTGKGSGLGLFIVHEIIEEHDGCIKVKSTPSVGTTFTIRLPLRSDGKNIHGGGICV
ncbi:MAG: ATP-binding protein [Candidatus Magnetoovum sp. WYHC-5]|nr:ATP-binding protein [Candidatus Magnetoovum sp. WYHC-5]